MALLLLNFDLLLVGVTAGTILPHLAARDRRLMGDKADVDETAEISRLRATVRQWRIEAARKGRALHLPMMPFLLRNIWTGALVFFSLLMLSTFFISTVFQVRLSLTTPNVHVFIMFRCLGNNIYQPCRYLLGSGYVGTICNHYGGKFNRNLVCTELIQLV